MKTRIFKFSMLFVLAGSLLLTGCNNDDDTPPIAAATCSDGIQNGGETGVDCGGNCPNSCTPAASTELNGSVTEDTTLDPTLTYQLTGEYSVESGVTLTVPAGTTIVADAAVAGSESDTYIVVQQGGSIIIQGTQANPVIMTSSNQNPGDWGGLVIAGEATTTEGEDATAEVGDIIYGGSDDADNSGSISYLIINYAGAQIDSESQYNGLTLYAVGSGTTIANVAILNGTDDGVEFFGGAVSANNIYLENNEDDAIDWTEGWSGSVSNSYILHTADFSTAVEADGVDGSPTLTNITAISTIGGTALQFKAQSGATITGLSLSGYDNALDFPVSGRDISNVMINGAEANVALSYVGSATVNASLFDWVGSALTVESNTLTGSITTDLTLDPAVDYFLQDSFSVESGATLTIPAGTRIVANAEGGNENDTYIVVQQGGSINIQGTEANPVIMTSSNQNPGDWGGLVIAGEATTTEGEDATAEVGDIIYGGSDDTDNSGSISYLVINYAGAQIDSESQYNGLTLYAVGSGTAIENVAILNGTDDGVEFFGGTVSASNLYLENNEDDAIDWTEGWSGTVANAYISHTADFSTAVEADGVDGSPTLTNITAVSTVGGTALQFKANSGAIIIGLSLAGYETTADFPVAGRDITNVTVEGATIDPTASYNAAATVDVSTFAWATGN